MKSGHDENWWSRRCGGREVLALALPLVISMGSWSLMHFVDRMFLLWHSTPAMAAVMPAGMLSFTVVCFPLGVAMYVNTFVAQYEGARRPERIGAVVWQGMRVGIYAMPLFLATIPLAPAVFRLAGHGPANLFFALPGAIHLEMPAQHRVQVPLKGFPPVLKSAQCPQQTGIEVQVELAAVVLGCLEFS